MPDVNAITHQSKLYDDQVGSAIFGKLFQKIEFPQYKKSLILFQFCNLPLEDLKGGFDTFSHELL